MSKLFSKLRRSGVEVHPLAEAKTLADYAVFMFTDAIESLDEAAGKLLDHEDELADRKAELEDEAEAVYAERVRAQKLAAKFRALVDAE